MLIFVILDGNDSQKSQNDQTYRCIAPHDGQQEMGGGITVLHLPDHGVFGTATG